MSGWEGGGDRTSSLKLRGDELDYDGDVERVSAGVATRRAGRPYYANRRVLRAQADCPLDQVEIHELTRMFVAQGHDVKV